MIYTQLARLGMQSAHAALRNARIAPQLQRIVTHPSYNHTQYLKREGADLHFSGPDHWLKRFSTSSVPTHSASSSSLSLKTMPSQGSSGNLSPTSVLKNNEVPIQRRTVKLQEDHTPIEIDSHTLKLMQAHETNLNHFFKQFEQLAMPSNVKSVISVIQNDFSHKLREWLLSDLAKKETLHFKNRLALQHGLGHFTYCLREGKEAFADIIKTVGHAYPAEYKKALQTVHKELEQYETHLRKLVLTPIEIIE